MLYQTLLQSKIFLCTVYFGIVCGVCLMAKKLIDNFFKNKKIVVLITDIFIFFVATILFLICINLFNYGEFRLYELAGFVLGIVLEQISLNKIVEKTFSLIYNLITKLINKLKTTKIFSKVLKWQKTKQKCIV